MVYLCLYFISDFFASKKFLTCAYSIFWNTKMKITTSHEYQGKKKNLSQPKLEVLYFNLETNPTFSRYCKWQNIHGVGEEETETLHAESFFLFAVYFFVLFFPFVFHSPLSFFNWTLLLSLIAIATITSILPLRLGLRAVPFSIWL